MAYYVPRLKKWGDTSPWPLPKFRPWYHVQYDVSINVAYKTLSKYFIQVLSFVTLVHITQTATRVGPNYTLHS